MTDPVTCEGCIHFLVVTISPIVRQHIAPELF